MSAANVYPGGAPPDAKQTPWQLAHAIEAWCTTCQAILAWGESDDGESIRFRAWSHRHGTGHDVEVRWRDPDWGSCALVAEINGKENTEWLER